MHFGPEWMRKQPIPASRSSQTDVQPGSTTAIPGLNPATPAPPISSYSASVTSGVVHPVKQGGGHPFRYSKEEMIRIYREAERTTLDPEVERWDGIIREIGADPVGMKEMGDMEKRVSMLRCPPRGIVPTTHFDTVVLHLPWGLSCFPGHSILRCGGDSPPAITWPLCQPPDSIDRN